MLHRILQTGCAIILFAGVVAAQKSDPIPARAETGKKLCVARVANSSGKPVPVDLVQQRLIEQLNHLNIQTVAAPTITTLADHLALSPSNQGAFRALKCDSMLLAEITEGPSEKSPVAVEFAVFRGSNTEAVHGTTSAVGSDPTQGALAALGAVADRVSGAISGKKK